MEMTFQHPLAFIEAACRESLSFAAIVKSKLGENSNRMSVCVYMDDIDAGNPLSDRHGRAITACYWSWCELSYPLLADELMWATLTAPRAHVLHRLPGGISQFFRHCGIFHVWHLRSPSRGFSAPSWRERASHRLWLCANSCARREGAQVRHRCSRRWCDQVVRLVR